MLFVTGAAVGCLPAVIPIIAVTDLVRGRWQLPTVRVYVFLTQYALNDSVEIVIAPWYWILARFGTRLDSAASIRRHERVQSWSIALLARRAEQLLGIRIQFDEDMGDIFEPGPIIVLCRHVSVLDASLAALLYQQRGYHVRHVIMAELLADPGFDLIYRRVGSTFIPRDNGPEARRAVSQLGATLDRSTVAVIFPEGRTYRPELLASIRTKLEHSDPARAERLTSLRHVLPIRPGGVSALLDAAPEADIVVIAHTGLDTRSDLRSLARTVPLTDPVLVTAWRTPRELVPADPADLTRWLDETWQHVDDWIDARHRT
jgi:1-acyl-sn-glycerol-3-phosphate acyltransferase